MKIISMVPSLTETLIAAGADVVGRTRFCIHPESEIKKISVVGGTKEISWQQVSALAPELVVLDREENPRTMADQCPVEYLATHITSVADVSEELRKIARRLRLGGDLDPSEKLLHIAERWARVSCYPANNFVTDIPGALEWLTPQKTTYTNVVYVIWKKPFMAVSKDTFIASVLEKLGVSPDTIWPRSAAKYPEFNLSDVPPESLLLFSSEPYPFLKKKPSREEIGPHAAAIVDGECFSWFGLRALVFLEQALGISW